MSDHLYNPFNVLRHVHPRASGMMAFGGGGSTTSTVTNQSIPKQFHPYFERMLIRGEEQGLQPYQPYAGSRIAGKTGDSLNSENMVRDLATAGQPTLDQAIDTTGQNMTDAQGMVGRPGYEFSEFQFGPSGTFDGNAASQYMSPYIQNVLDRQKSGAQRDYLEAQGGRSAAAVSAGAFGGSRQAVAESLAERDMLTRMGDIDATGLQAAYGDARSAFEADRAARMTTEQSQAGELSRVQAGQAGENLARDQFDLSALGQSSDMAAQLADLSERARAGDIQAAQLLEVVGRSNESRTQAGLDMGYEDFLRQQRYPMDQLQQFSAMISGLPIAPAGTTTQSVPYNPMQQALGMGISALGLYKGMQA